MRARWSTRKAFAALGLLLLLVSGSIAHHHESTASAKRANCPACELKQTTPVAPAPLIAVAAPPPCQYPQPEQPAVPAPGPRPPLAEAPKTSPPA